MRVLLLAQFKGKALNKNEIEKQAGMKGRQSIYNYIGELKGEGFRWIEVANSKPWRAGGISESYRLTTQGLYRAILYNPEFKQKAKLVLDFDFEKVREEREGTLERNRLAEMRYWFRTIEHVIENGKAPPTWYLTLDMRADDNGRLSYRIWEGTEEVDRLLKSSRENREAKKS